MSLIVKIISAVLISVLVLFLIRLYSEAKKSQTMTVDQTINPTFPTCSDKPNCVSSQTSPSDTTHYIKPIERKTNPIMELKTIMEEMGLNIISIDNNGIYSTHQSKIFGFIDDVRFYFDESTGLLHYQSASRVGYSDMGANRKRINLILAELSLVS